MKSEITFYGGLNTIGGVVMSIVYGKERILLEIGTAYEPATDVYDGTVLKREKNWLKDELKLKRVPFVDGIYRKEDLSDFEGLKSAQESDLHTSVFVTHMHLDHMSCMGILDDSVDVYLSKPAQILEEALEAVGEGVRNIRTKKFIDIKDREVVKIGDIEVMPFLLNEKSYQDWSFYVKTPDLKLHYTGDLFLHGAYKDAVIAEMEYITKEKIDVLVCEATTFMDSTMLMMYDSVDAKVEGNLDLPKGMLNKEMVDDILLSKLKALDGLCVFNFYEREMSDVLSFNAMGEACDRVVCYEPKTAYLIWKFFNQPTNIYIPDYAEFDSDASWFSELCANNKIVSKTEVLKAPHKYLIQNTYPHIMELFDLHSKGATYLHSGGMPIGSYDPAYKNLLKVLELAGFEHVNFFQKNYFSHAYPAQVKAYCDHIMPKVLVPTHSYNPERLYAKAPTTRLLPKLYQTYVLENDVLVEKK